MHLVLQRGHLGSRCCWRGGHWCWCWRRCLHACASSGTVLGTELLHLLCNTSWQGPLQQRTGVWESMEGPFNTRAAAAGGRRLKLEPVATASSAAPLAAHCGGTRPAPCLHRAPCSAEPVIALRRSRVSLAGAGTGLEGRWWCVGSACRTERASKEQPARQLRQFSLRCLLCSGPPAPG